MVLLLFESLVEVVDVDEVVGEQLVEEVLRRCADLAMESSHSVRGSGGPEGRVKEERGGRGFPGEESEGGNRRCPTLEKARVSLEERGVMVLPLKRDEIEVGT